MSINMTDVTFHLDEALDHDQRGAIRDELLGQDGIMAAAPTEATPHLMAIEFNPNKIDLINILDMFKKRRIHAERLG
jgi:hypothetical protein